MRDAREKRGTRSLFAFDKDRRKSTFWLHVCMFLQVISCCRVLIHQWPPLCWRLHHSRLSDPVAHRRTKYKWNSSSNKTCTVGIFFPFFFHSANLRGFLNSKVIHVLPFCIRRPFFFFFILFSVPFFYSFSYLIFLLRPFFMSAFGHAILSIRPYLVSFFQFCFLFTESCVEILPCTVSIKIQIENYRMKTVYAFLFPPTVIIKRYAASTLHTECNVPKFFENWREYCKCSVKISTIP